VDAGGEQVTWLEFSNSLIGHIVSLVGYLAWPSVIVFVFWRYKDEFRQLVSYLSHVKIGNFEASFRQTISEISETLEADAPEVSDVGVDDLDEYGLFEKVSSYSPRGAVLDSWRELEVRISRKYSELGSEGRFPPRRNLAKQALNDGTFSQDQYDAFLKLRSLRNEAAHNIDFNISALDAKSYVRSVARLSALLDS
jgi:hypothetical protein